MDESPVKSGYAAFKERLASVRHPVLIVLAVGILVRLIIMSVSIVYDADYWALVVRNIEAGHGLYEAIGYYYTPVWGYVLGIVAAMQDLFLPIGESAMRVIEAFPVELPSSYYMSATAPSLAFSYSAKMPLLVSDTILSFLVLHLVRDITGDGRKSVLAFALTFLCPVLIGSSCIIGMPDSIGIMFAVLTIILVRRNLYFLAGMTFCISVMTKFFPAFLIFILVAYILARSKGDVRRGVMQVVTAAVGATVALLVLLTPQIMEGTLAECFQFLTDRTGESAGTSLFNQIIGHLRVISYVVVLTLSVVTAVWMYRKPEADLEMTFMKGCLLVSTLCLVFPPTTQYIVMLVPFLAFWIAAAERRYVLSWKILAVGCIPAMFTTNALMFLQLAAWTDLVDINALMDLFYWYTSPVGPLTPMDIQFVIGGILQSLGVCIVLVLMYAEPLRERLAERKRQGAKPS